MDFNETAVLVLFIVLGGLLIASLAVALVLALSIISDATRGKVTEEAARTGPWRKWEHHEPSQIVGK